MELHVPKIVPSLFAQLKSGRTRVYVVGILNYEYAQSSYEQEFCWVFSNGDPDSGRKCETHNELQDLGPPVKKAPQKTAQLRP